ncbi:MAG: hypothetical protein KUG70_07310 [Rhodobacteraceae bacterium]|nr:hypothetical protein [Paracoccaceae bacterium]
MFEALLINTSTEGLKPLGSGPQRSFELISDTVRQRFGPAHASLFAEPVATEFGDRFDWYATSKGTATRLADLQDDEGAARAVLNGLVSDIKEYSAELLSSKAADDQRLGEALSNALEIPDEQSIYVLRTEGDAPEFQPVLVNWAWTRDEQSVVRGVLTGMDGRVASARPGYVAPVRVPTTEEAAKRLAPAAVATGVSALWWWLVWLGWLLLALLIAAVIYLMIEPCSLKLSWFPGNCAQAETRTIGPQDARRLLEDQIAQVEKEIGIADRNCQPKADSYPIPAPLEDAALPPAFSQQDVENRLAEAGAKQGDLAFTLIWDGSDDLDLNVTCPTKETVFFVKKAACNGVLDVDSNSATVTPNPVENTYFVDPYTGAYKINVHLYKARSGDGMRAFTLQIRDGGRVSTHSGTVSTGQPTWQFNYQYEGK